MFDTEFWSILKSESYYHIAELNRNMKEKDTSKEAWLGGVEAQHQLLFLLGNPLSRPVVEMWIGVELYIISFKCFDQW